MINKDKTLRDIYPYAYDCAGTDRIHPAFMFEQLSRRERHRDVPEPLRSGTSGSTLPSCQPACSGAKPARRVCARTVRINGWRENFLVTTCDAASLAARLYKTQIASPYARRHAVWRVRCNRMR